MKIRATALILFVLLVAATYTIYLPTVINNSVTDAGEDAPIVQPGAPVNINTTPAPTFYVAPTPAGVWPTCPPPPTPPGAVSCDMQPWGTTYTSSNGPPISARSPFTVPLFPITATVVIMTP